MKVLYFVNHPIGTDDGVVKKVLSQVEFFRKNGAETKVLAFSEDGKSSQILEAFVIRTSALKSRLFLHIKAIKFVREFNPDVIYARYDTFIFTQLILRYIFGFKIVFEINTYDLSEAMLLYRRTKSIKELAKYLVYFLSRKIWLNWVSSGLVFVTADLKNMYGKVVRKGTPCIAVPNSLDLKRFGRYERSMVTEKELLFIGTPNQPWHGIDKLVKLAKQLPEFKFNIVGSYGEDSTNVKYHGYLGFEDYIKIYDKCFACIGPLAIDRYGLNQSSPLKIREYIALGKPVIFGYEDFPLSEISSLNFCRLSDIDGNWANEIRSFYMRHDVMGPYDDKVKSLVDSNIIESKRFEFLRAII